VSRTTGEYQALTCRDERAMKHISLACVDAGSRSIVDACPGTDCQTPNIRHVPGWHKVHVVAEEVGGAATRLWREALPSGRPILPSGGLRGRAVATRCSYMTKA